VYLNAGDGPVDAREAANLLEGEIPGTDSIAAAAEVASQKEINPFGNIHTSPDFQRHLARLLTRRALKLALERANEDVLQ
jgi:carbon-monoxide dehydrogenase medium subunit